MKYLSFPLKYNLIIGNSDRVPCIKRYFPQDGGDSFVCVCNSTYCDTVETITKTDNNQYQEYITCKDGYRLDKFVNRFDYAPENSLYYSFLCEAINK